MLHVEKIYYICHVRNKQKMFNNLNDKTMEENCDFDFDGKHQEETVAALMNDPEMEIATKWFNKVLDSIEWTDYKISLVSPESASCGQISGREAQRDTERKPEKAWNSKRKTSEIEVIYKSYVSEDSFTIRQEDDVLELMMRIGYFADNVENKEMMYALYINQIGTVVGVMKMGEGTSYGCLIDKMYMFQGAILQNVNNILLVHNRPGGRLQPTSKDINITKGILQACKIMGMHLVDHIIITRKGYLYIKEYL